MLKVRVTSHSTGRCCWGRSGFLPGALTSTSSGASEPSLQNRLTRSPKSPFQHLDLGLTAPVRAEEPGSLASQSLTRNCAGTCRPLNRLSIFQSGIQKDRRYPRETRIRWSLSFRSVTAPPGPGLGRSLVLSLPWLIPSQPHPTARGIPTRRGWDPVLLLPMSLEASSLTQNNGRAFKSP